MVGKGADAMTGISKSTVEEWNQQVCAQLLQQGHTIV
jgi:hypothetical protein